MIGHPTGEQLAALVAGKLGRRGARTVVAHLLRGCRDCSRLAGTYLRPGRDLPEDAYDRAFERALERLREHLAARTARQNRPPVPGLRRPGLQL